MCNNNSNNNSNNKPEHHISSDLFDDETDKFDDLLRYHSQDDGDLEGPLPITGSLLGTNGRNSGGPPGFSLGGSDGGGGMTSGLLAYAPQQSSGSTTGGTTTGTAGGIAGRASPLRNQSQSQSMHHPRTGSFDRDSREGRGSEGMSHTQTHTDDTSSSSSSSAGGSGGSSTAVVTLSFTVRCSLDFHNPMQVASVRMASSLFNHWSLDHALPMRRSVGDSDVYGLNVEVPLYLPYFSFKYVITDVDGLVWMEPGAPVVMDVSQRVQLERQFRQRHGGGGGGEKMALEQEDVLRAYVPVPPGPFLYASSD